ncbi:CCA-adding enzyme [compost metagenome]
MIHAIHDDVKELLSELNAIDKSVVFGGYLRGLYLGKASSDIDIATNIPIEIIEAKYGNLEKAGRRKTISGHDLFSFKMHRTEKMFVEIVCTTDDVLNKAKQADYTINSLMYDGKQVIGNNVCFDDMQNKVIRAVDTKIIANDLSTRPYLWLKTIRMTSEFGFGLSQHMYGALQDHRDVIRDISPEIMQAEGHKTLNGKGLLRAIQYLKGFYFIKSYQSGIYHEEKFSVHVQPHQKLCLLAILTNEQVANEFIEFYHLPLSLKEKYEELYKAYFSEEKIANRLKHQAITIKKIVN